MLYNINLYMNNILMLLYHSYGIFSFRKWRAGKVQYVSMYLRHE